MAKPEKKVEDYLVRQCKIRGYWAIKLIILNLGGFPDRTILAPGGRVFFVELKASKSSPMQPNQIPIAKRILSFGFSYSVIYEKTQVDHLMQQIGRSIESDGSAGS